MPSHLSKLILQNWRSFHKAEADLSPLHLITGPNASGKTNLLDAVQFLHDLARPSGGGMQQALESRGGIQNIRTQDTRGPVRITAEIQGTYTWRYEIEILQIAPKGHRLKAERVWKGKRQILNRPTDADRKDPDRLRQTHLEQISQNGRFREIYEFLRDVSTFRGLGPNATPVGESRGIAQMTGTLQALEEAETLLIMDGPDQNLDPQAADGLMCAVRITQEAKGMQILIASPNLQEQDVLGKPKGKILRLSKEKAPS